MLPSYIEDDVKAQITNDNELHDQYCLVFMSQKLPSLNYTCSCPLNFEGSLLAFGGWDGEKQCCVSTIQRYVPETNTWVAAGELPRAVFDCTCIMTSGKLYVFGGKDAITMFKSTYILN